MNDVWLGVRRRSIQPRRLSANACSYTSRNGFNIDFVFGCTLRKKKKEKRNLHFLFPVSLFLLASSRLVFENEMVFMYVFWSTRIEKGEWFKLLTADH